MKIRVGSIGDIEIYVHLAAVLHVIYAVISGTERYFLIILLSLAVHEVSHVLMANACGIHVNEIYIQPIGLTAGISEHGLSTKDEIAVYSIGPIFSLGIGIGIVGICGVYKHLSQNLLEIGYINVIIALLNAVPVYPLDGSCVFRALLSQRLTQHTIKKILLVNGLIAAILVLYLAIALYRRGNNHLALFFAAIMIIVNTILCYKSRNKNTIVKNRFIFSRKGYINVKTIAVHESMTACEALMLVADGSYMKFILLDKNNAEVGMITSEDVYDGMLHYGKNTKLSYICRQAFDQNHKW